MGPLLTAAIGLAADAVIVAVEVWTVAGFAPPHGRRPRRTGGGAIGEGAA